ncbi:MAG: hypothetical protein RMZ42_32915 [Nostoc sp. DedQUE05]|uniref:hypothetical protein n=1 Tax=Nostoc sp. DedQUE05 TaxID=3075391 RepID=UPI002AD236AF|nr:hypothetical protein [Nostoc sp. DedQUE05]MDZ8096703.1 hypothetical protein [Nostoc sp. DedQUE05]
MLIGDRNPYLAAIAFLIDFCYIHAVLPFNVIFEPTKLRISRVLCSGFLIALLTLRRYDLWVNTVVINTLSMDEG